MVELVQAKFVRHGVIASIVIGTESQSYKHFTEENKHHFNVPVFVYKYILKCVQFNSDF